MYYIDKLREQIQREAQAPSSLLSAASLNHALWLLEQAAPQIAYLERVSKVAEVLGISENNIAFLESVVESNLFRASLHELQYKVRFAVDEAAEAERDNEQENAIALLEVAGFALVETDGFDGWERTTPGTGASQENSGKVERVTIITKRPRHGWFHYEFTLSENGVETLHGKSGEFGKLLQAVGISQEVGQ